MIAGISYLDAALVAVVAISGLVAMYRGFTREVLSILSWVAAAIAAFYVIFYQQDFAEELAKQFADPPQQVHLIIAQHRHRQRHLPGGSDHRSPHHVAHLRHGARQPHRGHRPHPRAWASALSGGSSWW